ncbi:MAG: exported protein of unknown function [Modestobacter sp.]|nr:exported protein of unknown function [Modestobacter sp.]MCW2675394.1 exported protein of unknown function [Modestobacter sp.]
MRGQIRRTAGRALALALAGWVLAMGGSVLLAPSASAEPAVTVAIRDLTPPLVSVDAGGSVTFVNQIADKPVQVGGGLLPTLVNVTAHTDVTLKVPSGTKPLPAGASVTETFAATCVGCTITYTYRLQSSASLTSAVTDAALKMLPPLPAPTPFVVNTLVPLPNLPSLNLPRVPAVTVPAPSGPTPQVPQVPTPAAPAPHPPAPGSGAPADGGAQTVNGTPYSYGTSGGAAQLAPTASSAVSALASSYLPGQAMGRRDATGSGGVVGDYDGASVPVFGQLAGLDTAVTGQDGAVSPDAAGTAAGTGLSVPALLAFIALAGASSALVRSIRLQGARR